MFGRLFDKAGSSRHKANHRAKRRKRARRHLRFEALEERMLLSHAHIEWKNEGSATDDSDHFNEMYGDDAETARVIVRRAIDDWERVITDFKWFPTYKLRIVAKDVNAVARTIITNVVGPGIPQAAKITLDNNANGFRWYFDPNIGTATTPDDSEFSNSINPFAACQPSSNPKDPSAPCIPSNPNDKSDPANQGDFYSAVLHEIGHAMGIVRYAVDIDESSNFNLLIAEFLDPIKDSNGDRVKDPNDSTATLMRFDVNGVVATFSAKPLLWQGGDIHLFPGDASKSPANPPGATLHPDELMNTGGTTGIRYLISDLTADILEAAYGYEVTRPSDINTFHANLDRSTGQLTVQGIPGTNDDSISIDVVHSKFDIDNIEIRVNGTSERIPVAAVTDIQVIAGDGQDTINVLELPESVDMTILAGAGNDIINIAQDDIDDMVHGSLTVRGDTGFDTINVNDQADSYPDVYDFGRRLIGLGDSGTWERWGRLTKRRNSGAATRFGGMLFDATVDLVVLNAGAEDNTINVNGVMSTTSLILYGGGGTDAFHVGAGYEDVDSHVKGEIYIVGGDADGSDDSSADKIYVHDQADTSDDDYTVTHNSLTKNSRGTAVFGGLSYQAATIEYLTLYANPDDNKIYVESLSAGTNLTVEGGEGNNTTYIGVGDIDDEVEGSVFVGGGSDTDKILVNDRNDGGKDVYTINYGRLGKSGAGGTPFGGLVHDTAVEKVYLYANPSDNTINVESLWPTTEVILYGRGGNDVFNVGDGDVDSHVQGTVRIYGGDGVHDKVVIDDNDDSGTDDYTVRATSFTKSNFGTLSYTSVEGVVLYAANSQVGNIYVESTYSANPVVLYTGDAYKDVYLGHDGKLSSFAAPVYVVSDNLATQVTVDDSSYAFDTEYAVRGTAWRSGYVTRSSPFGSNVVLYYDSVGRLYLNTGRGGDVIDINEGTLEIYVTMGDGADEIVVTDADWLEVDGQGGIDKLTWNDQAASEGRYYRIADDGFDMGAVYESSIEELILRAGGGNDTFDIDGTPAGTPVTIYAGDGADIFRVSGLSSDLALHGEDPIVAPGDQLVLSVGASQDGTYPNQNNPASDGSLTVGGHAIDYTGLDVPLSTSFTVGTAATSRESFALTTSTVDPATFQTVSSPPPPTGPSGAGSAAAVDRALCPARRLLSTVTTDLHSLADGIHQFQSHTGPERVLSRSQTSTEAHDLALADFNEDPLENLAVGLALWA